MDVMPDMLDTEPEEVRNRAAGSPGSITLSQSVSASDTAPPARSEEGTAAAAGPSEGALDPPTKSSAEDPPPDPAPDLDPPADPRLDPAADPDASSRPLLTRCWVTRASGWLCEG